jgi:hypothetical protein
MLNVWFEAPFFEIKPSPLPRLSGIGNVPCRKALHCFVVQQASNSIAFVSLIA